MNFRRWLPGPAEVGLILLGIALALVVLEAVLRVAGLGYRVDHNWSYHPRFGWTQVPGANYRYRLGDEELNIAFNGEGFRDRDHDLAKPPGVRRIAVVGDSFSEAVQVPVEQTFHRRLERLLLETGGDWEVMNFGVGDYGTVQQALLLRERVLAYDPDIVIHQIFPLNDVCNNNPALFGLCKSDNDPYRPYARLDDGGLEYFYPQPARKWFREHLRSYFMLERVLIRLGQRLRGDDYWDEKFIEAGYRELEPLLYTYVPDPAPRAIEQGWQISEALIEQIVNDTRAAGASYLAMVVPFEARVTKKSWGKLLNSQGPGARRMSRDYAEKRLARLFRELGAKVVLLRPRFERHPEALPYRLGHLSPAGHRIAAKALFEALGELPGSGVPVELPAADDDEFTLDDVRVPPKFPAQPPGAQPEYRPGDQADGGEDREQEEPEGGKGTEKTQGGDADQHLPDRVNLRQPELRVLCHDSITMAVMGPRFNVFDKQ